MIHGRAQLYSRVFKGYSVEYPSNFAKKNEYVHYVFCMYACKLDFGTKLKGIPALSVKMD